MEKLTIATFDLFNAVPVTSTEHGLSSELLEYGFVVPDNLDPIVVATLKQKAVKLGHTFYQSWADITKRSGYQILVDHIIHYVSVWLRQEHNSKFFVIPGDGVPNQTPSQQHAFRVVRGISVHDLKQKTLNLLYTSVAFKEETINHIMTILFSDLCGDVAVDMNLIGNRDCRTFFHAKMGQPPTDPVALLRCIVFDLTGSLTLIKSKDAQTALSSSKVDPTRWLKGNEVMLATIFNRFKPLFMALKATALYYPDVATTINKIGHMSKVKHTPGPKQVKDKFLETMAVIERMNGFQLSRHLKHLMNQRPARMHLIRNGKVWCERERADDIGLVRKHLERRLDHVFAIVSPQVRVALPTSEKNFVGPFPIGTEIKPSHGKCLVVGIFWRNKIDTRVDLDLSCEDMFEKVGWDGEFKTNDIFFSGDVTNAPDGANEMLFFKRVGHPKIINVNWFTAPRHQKDASVEVDIIIGEMDPADATRDNLPTMMSSIQDYTTVVIKTTLTAKTRTIGVIYPERGLVLIDKDIGANSETSRWTKDKAIVIDSFTKHNLFFDSFCRHGTEEPRDEGALFAVRRRLFAPPRLIVNLKPGHISKDVIMSVFA